MALEIMVPMPQTKKIDLGLKNKSESETWLRSSKYYDEWQSWYDLYMGIPKKKPYEWMSNKFFPLVMSKVETALTNIQSVLFAGNPPFDVRPRENADEEQAKLIRHLLQYQFEESGVYNEFSQFLRSLCVFGTAIGKIVWDYKFQEVVEWQPQFSPFINILGMNVGQRFTGMAPQTMPKTVYAYPRLITLNIADCFPDPQSIDIQDGWFIHRTRRSKDYLLRMNQMYPDIYNDEVMKITDQDVKEYKDSTNEIQSNMGRLTQPAVTRVKGEGGIELLERWGLQESEGKLVPWVSTIACGKYLIRDTKNPYWHGKIPAIKGVYIPSINDFYGIGIPEVMEDLQNNFNEIVNQRNDNISFALNRPVARRKFSGTQKDFVLKPGAQFVIDEQDDIRKAFEFMQIPDYSKDSFVHTQEIERIMQEVTAVTKLTLGITGKDSNDTATGMNILQRASGERFMGIARHIEDKCFKELIKMFYQLDYQYIEQDEMIRIVGEKGIMWQKVSPDVIRRSYDFVPAGIFTMENKMQKSLRLIQGYNILKGNPMLKESRYLRKLIESLEVTDDVDEFIRPDAEVQEIMMMAQTLAMKMHEDMMAQQEAKAPAGKGSSGKQKTNIPGMPKPGQLRGVEMPGTPGMPPAGPAVPPGERV